RQQDAGSQARTDNAPAKLASPHPLYHNLPANSSQQVCWRSGRRKDAQAIEQALSVGVVVAAVGTEDQMCGKSAPVRGNQLPVEAALDKFLALKAIHDQPRTPCPAGGAAAGSPGVPGAARS